MGKIILSVVLLLGLSTSAPPTKSKDINKALEPYQTIIDKLNKELGTTFYIPEKNKEKFLNNIKGKTLAEFETLVQEEYKSSVSDSEQEEKYIRDSAVGKNSGPDLIPNAKGSINLIPLQ